MKIVLKNAVDVANWRLCLGCGACVAACPDKKLALVDFTDQGLRPVFAGGDCGSCSDCIEVCPGVGVSHSKQISAGEAMDQLQESWGPVLEVWEGYASDPDIRFSGSSGGLASALALYCIEKMGMHGIAHAGPDNDLPYRNRSLFSRTRKEVLSATGSRYSPASPCEQIPLLEEAEGPCVFIGKPCDIEGLRKTQAIRPKLARNVGAAIGIFCAGTPSTRGTLDLLRKFGIRHEEVEEIRYRGRGWPGNFSIRLKGSSAWKELGTYQEAWGFLEKYRPYRCYLCPDSTSEFADLSCGDPWYREIEEGEHGTSLVLVRTEKGREILKGAMEAGYVRLQPVKAEVLNLSQKELKLKRGAIWGRVLSMRALGIPAPRLHGFSLFRNWLKMPFRNKLRSILGTAKRVISRKYYLKHQYQSQNHEDDPTRRPYGNSL